MRGLLGDRVTDVQASQQLLNAGDLSDPVAFREYFKQNYGPTIAAYRGLAEDPERTAELDQALLDLVERFRTPDGKRRMGVPAGHRHEGLTASRHAGSGPTISTRRTFQWIRPGDV